MYILSPTRVPQCLTDGVVLQTASTRKLSAFTSLWTSCRLLKWRLIWYYLIKPINNKFVITEKNDEANRQMGISNIYLRNDNFPLVSD